MTAGRPSVVVPPPVSILRTALERTGVLVKEPLELVEGTGASAADHVSLFEIKRFGALDAERVRELTVSMLASFASARLELVLWVQGDGHRLRFFVGRVDRHAQPAERELMRTALSGFFHGAHIEPVERHGSERRQLFDHLRQRRHAVGVVGIPSERSDTPQESRLDESYDALARTRFDLIIIANTVDEAVAATGEDNLIMTVDAARACAKMTSTDTQSFQRSFSESLQESTTRSATLDLSTSTTERNATSTNDSTGGATGAMAGAVLGGALGWVAGGPVGVVAGAKVGAIAGNAVGKFIRPDTQQTQERGASTQTRHGLSTNETETRGQAEQMAMNAVVSRTVEAVSTSAEILARTANKHLERIEQGRGLGLWSTSVRIVADDAVTADQVGHLVVGALRGDRSHLGPLGVVQFKSPSDAARRVADFAAIEVRGPKHPVMPRGEQPETWLSSTELALYFRPPTTPVSTLDVRPPVHFGRWLPAEVNDASIVLGDAVTGTRMLGRVAIPLSDLTRHTFIAGTTGAGKTTTVRSILRQLADQNIPFLVLEPAKTEYRALYEELKAAGKEPLRVVVGRPRAEGDRSFKFNPLRAPLGVPLGRHIEGVKTLLLGSFDMHEGLPQAMERLLFDAFARFQLEEPIDHQQLKGYPSLKSLAEPRIDGSSLITRAVDSLGYEPRIRDNYKAALRLRLESFQRGVKRSIFDGPELDFSELLRRPTFIELNDLTEPDVRRFVMGAFMLRLYGEREGATRRAAPERTPSGLRHLLVLEEAHHFLREGSGSASAAQLARHGNELLADAFAELRSYGQGILVADQAPAELSAAVLRNTATKIVHTLFHEADCVAVGNSIGIEEAQRGELRRLRPGEAVVQSPRYASPVLCKVDALPER